MSDQVWSFRYDGENKTDFANRTVQMTTDAGAISNISSFGEDNAGNLYIVSLGGDVFRFDSAVERKTLVDCGPSADCRSNNQITTYFRRAFDVADASLVESRHPFRSSTKHHEP